MTWAIIGADEALAIVTVDVEGLGPVRVATDSSLVAGRAGSVAVRPEPLSGQFSINGSTGPENSFLIDGQETQNYRNGLLNTNNDIPYQAVQEIQVKTSGFEAEFGGATGIAGGTGSGKSTVARNVAQALSTSSVAFIDMDAYYREAAKRVPVGRVGEAEEFADLVTDMSKVKHPMDAGQKGQKGIEW